jgi:nucleoside-diphosphate-sugar epimerase
MKISIIGLGWFGQALGHELRSHHEIWGTTRTQQKAQQLIDLGFHTLTMDHPQHPSEELLAADVIIVNIPPRAEHLEWFKSWKWNSKSHVIFISSTSVYGDHQGHVDEQTPPGPDTESGKILVEQEKFFSQFSHSTIIRFGGLIGGGRHPGKILSGRKNLEGAQRPVNLVHQKDTVGFVVLVIEKQLVGTFNLVNPDHPTRESYYQDYCLRHQLTLPEFTPGPSAFKVINSKRVSSFYQFRASLKDD